ncbi:MAG: FtsX-like permease family protein, partial [Planctomycetaceae bacterium]
ASEAAVSALEREKKNGEESLRREHDSRAALLRQREELAAALVPLVLAGCALGIGLLAFANVRQRSGEIGILRAIGVRSSQILWLVLAKAIVFGLIGAALGYTLGFWFGIAWGDLPSTRETAGRLFGGELLLLSLVLAPLLAALASWIPALLAARQDPAVVLQQE